MEKNREVRRGGVVGKRHVSVTRRSRASSGFKYSSAVSNEDGDDMVGNNPSTSPRLQESRSKKQAGRMSPSLQEDNSYKDLDRSQNKRKRPGLQEPLSLLSTSTATVPAAMDDNSDDTEMGRSDDDDDLPPPTVPRRPWKLKLHGKPREDLSPIDPAAVPRKLRTAMTKRQQESTSHLHVADIPKQRLQNDATAMCAPTSSNVVVNPSRKKKPDNQKPPTAKIAKTSSSKVSKTEVEVAETLFDLARMFAAETVPLPSEQKAEPILATKSGSASSATDPDRKRSPAADVASPSSSLANSQTGVLKKKHPQISLKTQDEELPSVLGPCSSADPTLCPHSEKGQSQMESKASPKGGTLVTPVIGLMAASPNVKIKSENPVDLEAKIKITEGSSPPSMNIRSTTHPSEVLAISNLAVPVNVVNKDTDLAENLHKREAKQNPELGNRPFDLAPKDGGPDNKFEIDLMALPHGIDKDYEFPDSNIPDVKEKDQTLPNNHNGDGDLDSNMTSPMEKDEVYSVEKDGIYPVEKNGVYPVEKDEVELATIPSAEIALVNKERKTTENSKNMELDKDNKQPIESLEQHECNDWTTEKDNGTVKERSNNSDALEDRVKQEVVKQTLKGTGNNVKTDLVAHTADLNVSAKCTTTSNLTSTPLPASMAGWPAAFPHLTYYSPVAAAAAAVAASWSTPQSVSGMSSSENNNTTPQRSSFFFPPRRSRNRCATHVYITDFIYSQQQMKSNPLWAVAYGNPTAMYGNGIVRTPLSNSREPESVVCLKEKEPTGAAPAAANVHGAKEKAVHSGFDTVEIKSSQKQTQTGQKNSLMSVKNEPVFGLPVTVSAAASVGGSGTGTANTTGNNILVTAATVSVSGCASTASSCVSGTGNGLLDGSVAQAQPLNLVLQQPNFPFSISTSQFESTYGGHPQQVPHFFSNTIYDTHLVSQQLANTTSPNAPQKQPKISQGSFPPGGSSQLQYQEAFTSSQATLSLSGSPSQQSKHSNEKNITTDSRSAKKQIPMVQRNMYSQNFPHALSIHSQDFSLMANSGGKQTGKIKQQAPAQILPMQQVTAQVQKQQKAYLSTQYHAPAPALQTDLNEFNSKLSQSSFNRGPASSDLMGLPGIASIMTSQGELLQGMADLARGHAQIQKSIQNQMNSGQSHQYNMSGSHDQKILQRQHALMERAVAANTAETGRIINEGIYGKFGHEESQKESTKCELDQPNVFRLERESSRNMQGSQTNNDPKRVSTVNSTVTVGKLLTGQGIHFPGQNAGLASQGLRRSHAMQDSAQLRTTPVATAASTPYQAMQGVTSKSQGQQSRSEQPTMNSGSISRITTAPSLSSSVSATSPLPSLQAISKSGIGVPTKNSVSVKDCHSSLYKSPMASTSAKGVSAANMASVLTPGPSSTLQAPLNQNHYSIQQQHQQHLQHQQTMQFMDPSQKHHGQTVLQNYPLNHNYSHQSNKHPSMQQQHLQFGQHILFHQPSSLQYEVRTQSQVPSQSMSQQSTLHHQQSLQQLQQPPGQTASLTQQRGNIQQQHLKHPQPVPTMPFGVPASGTLPHNTGSVDTGNASLSIVSDGGKSTAKSTGEINITCPSSKTSCSDGSVRPHSHNSAVSSLQHVSSSNTVSVPYPNSLSHPMPNSGAVEKLSEKANQ
ncbi:hypothetical protein KI387_035546 [Taxus chinensis]|uniref:Uncharacterized protein n=1 Tax=Taxus chinensis TaxID=29808 RepID=A0AA38FPD4_TAXCH|nr:hypothetical protein KI387_035546 [Taxus chinensis]